MSDYSVTNYNPIKISYMQNQPIRTSAQPINNQVISPNFQGKVLLDTPPDTVEISAEDKLKKQGMSTGINVLLGIAGTAVAAYGCIVGHRAFNKPSLEKVAKNFSEIFRHDISKEEAQIMSDRFAQIFKIKDDKEFQNKLFQQLNKDYGLEHTNFDFTIKQLNNGTKGYFTPYGKPTISTNPDGSTKIELLANTCFGFDSRMAKNRTELFKTMVHEMNHAKQFELAYRTNWQEASADRFKFSDLEFINELKAQGYDIDKLLRDSLEHNVTKVSKNDLAIGSKEYELGLQYIENNKNYIPSNKDFSGYKKQLVEAESYKVEELMDNSLNYFVSIWRI